MADGGAPTWEVGVGQSRLQLAPGQSLVVGRGEGVDVRLEAPVVSRRHVRLANVAGRLEVEDLGSHGGSFVDGYRVEGVRSMTGPGTLALSPDGVPAIRLLPAAPPRPAVPGPVDLTPRPEAPRPAPGASGLEIALADGLVLGRELDHPGVALDADLQVSRRHAVVARGGQGWVVRDLGSRNGTFVNGSRVDVAPLGSGDRLTVGQSSFVVRGDTLRPWDETGVPAVVVSHVGRRLPTGMVLLDDVSFVLQPGTMLGVVGPSGAGKSTLLGALTGDRPATSGRIFYAGRDLATSLGEIRARIGLVPQDDIVHRQLRLRDALLYAARLRLPDDVAPALREQRVDAVLAELGLSEHGATRVDRLSGGQRKRASVAMELLTSPSFLLLDEPTSGLDPALDRQLMQSLRALADGGRTVMVISHNTNELHLCDYVLFLAPGGRVAFFGPPDEVLEWFGSRDFADAFDLAYRDADGVVNRFRTQRSGSHPLPALPDQGPPIPPVKPSRQRVQHQFTTLVRRHVRALAADRGLLAFSAVLPVALAALALLVPGDQGLRGPAMGKVPSGQPVQILLILMVGAVFMGLSSAIRELVGERTIFLRERAVGLSRVAYLASKIAVLGAVVTAQVLVMLVIVLLLRKGPEDPLLLSGEVELLVALVAAGVVNVVLGLALSGVIRTLGQTMPILVMTVMAELVFTSGLFALTGRGAIEVVSWLFPSRWAFAAGASVLDFNNNGLRDVDDPLWEHAFGVYLLDLGVVAVFVAVLAILAWWTTGRRYADR